MNAASVISKLTPERGAIAAIIRKDLRTLWPFAFGLAVLLLGMTAFFRIPADYPDVMLDFGRSQLHLAPALFLFNSFGLPAVIATFIVMLVHQDPAADARNDWMVRPIAAFDIVAAKALVILAVVLIPSAIGNFIYATTRGLSVDAAIGPIILTLIGCIFMLVVAWLASGPVQALLTPLVLAIATLTTVLSLGLSIGLGVVATDARQQAAELRAAADTGQLVLPEAPVAPPPPSDPVAPAVLGATENATVTAPAPAIEETQRQATLRAVQERMSGGGVSALQRREVERDERVIDLTWPILIAEFLLMLGGAGVVLWLLLVRRRLFVARMTFLGFFGAAVLLMLLQGALSTPRDEMIALRSVTSTLRPSPPQAERLAAFAKHDADKDGRLDRWEYRAVLEELGFSNQYDSLWLQRDDNMDGFISAEEYTPAIPAAPGGPPAPDPQRFAAFTRNDANKDRRLDRAEYQAVLNDLGFAGQFDTLWAQRDGDRDGFVSAEEYGIPAPAAEAPPP